MSRYEQYDYSEKRTFFGRFGFAIGLGAVAVIGVILFSQVFAKRGRPAPRKAAEMVMVRPLGPTPPPPPPPPPQMMPKQQMMEQSALSDQELKPEDQAPEAPVDALGTNVNGTGPADGFGLGRRDQGAFAGGGGRGGTGGSRFGWYASGVVKSVSAALRENASTRNARFDVKVRIWSDVTGRVIRAKLAGSTGDPAVDDTIQNRILTGFQLPEPPPDGMPMPIVMRLVARRPN